MHNSMAGRRKGHIYDSGCALPGLLSVGGERRSLICASLSPSTHCTSRVRSRGQLEVQSADTAAQEQPDSLNTRRPKTYSGTLKH